MERVPFRANIYFGHKICIGIQTFFTQIGDVQHGAVRMSGVQTVAVAVADMTAECLDDGFMVIGMKRFAENQVFFRHLFQKNMSGSRFGTKEKPVLRGTHPPFVE